MTNNNHPITPPPELVQEWREEAAHRQYSVSETEDYLIEQAAQYSADQELEACCEWLGARTSVVFPAELRAARRPKPPNLKEEALEALMTADGPDHPTPMLYLRPDAASIIRRALESIPDPS